MEENGGKKSPKKHCFRYQCECCNYKCSAKGNYDQHLATHKHKINQIGGIGGVKTAPKTSQIFPCKLCDYVSYKRSDYIRHIATRKHLTNVNRAGNAPKNIDTHVNARQFDNTINHKNDVTPAKKTYRSNKVYPCSLCDKKYVGTYGLERHRRVAHAESKISQTDETVAHLCKRNDELYQTIIDISKKTSAPIYYYNN